MVVLFQILLAFATFVGILPVATEPPSTMPVMEPDVVVESEQFVGFRSIFVNYLPELPADQDTVWRASIETVDGFRVTGNLYELTDEYVCLFDDETGRFAEVLFSDIQAAEFDQVGEVDWRIYVSGGNLFFASLDALLCQLESDPSSIVYLVTFPVINPAQVDVDACVVDACGCGVHGPEKASLK